MAEDYRELMSRDRDVILGTPAPYLMFVYIEKIHYNTVMDDYEAFSDDDLAAEALSVVQPYQFEPRRRVNRPVPTEIQSDTEESDVELDRDNTRTDTRTDNFAWCDCGNCTTMPTNTECICCHEIGPMDAILSEKDMECITLHEGFQGNCLNRYVIQVSLLDYVQLEGPIDDNNPIHELYRHIAYRRFTRWIWFRLGKGRRKVIPSCAVRKIREAFLHQRHTVDLNILGLEGVKQQIQLYVQNGYLFTQNMHIFILNRDIPVMFVVVNVKW